MKQELSLNLSDFSPLTEDEAKETNGGVWWLPAAAVVAIIISAANNFGDIRQGFSDGYHNKAPRHQG